MSTGVIRQPLLQINSLDPGWQRDLCSHSLPSRAKGMWKIVQHCLKLLPGSDISVLLTFHWPKQVIQSLLTLNWEGTHLPCTWKEEREKYLGSSTNDYTRQYVKLLIHVSIFTTPWWRNCISLIFYNMRNQGLMICKWSNRIQDQICWIPIFVLITKRLFCFLKYSELTFIELRDYRGTTSKCFVHFVSFHPHSVVK